MFKKFKGHYSKRKTHKTDRDVMSYEDMPLDDYEQEKTEMSPQAVKKNRTRCVYCHCCRPYSFCLCKP